jgi:hypothetical protein
MGMTAARLRERRAREILNAPRLVEPRNVSVADRLTAAQIEIRKLNARIAELEAEKPVLAPQQEVVVTQPIQAQPIRQDRPQQNQKFRRG